MEKKLRKSPLSMYETWVGYHLQMPHLSVAAVFTDGDKLLLVRQDETWILPSAPHCSEFPGLVEAARRVTRPLGVRIKNTGASSLGMYPHDPVPASEQEWVILRLPVEVLRVSECEHCWVKLSREDLASLGQVSEMVWAVFAHHVASSPRLAEAA